MNPPDLEFDRPRQLEATCPPEDRGIARDMVRLLVSRPDRESHHQFGELDGLLRRGDLLVVNESAMVPASLPAVGPPGRFLVNLSTQYGPDLWLTEPRHGVARPGPLPFLPGDRWEVAGLAARVVAADPGLPRLVFLRFAGDVAARLPTWGRPIRYGYLDREYPMDRYQTVFARVPGSAEMPSAARPFTPALRDRLVRRGIRIATIVLHAGVSSLEVETEDVAAQPLYPEPFWVPAGTAHAIEQTRARGGRVIAVGSTVVRALESAWDGCGIRAASGFTRLYMRPGRRPRAFDALLTGLHDPRTTHLAMMLSVLGPKRLRRAYREAVDAGYLWHEFGDSHLILPN